MNILKLSTQRLPRQFLSRNMTSSTINQSKMLGHQATLPKLPVPVLKDTLTKYLRSVKPLLNETEYLKTVQAVEEFQKPGGWGEKLQDRLVTKASDPKVDNWLEDWWNDLAYFGYRDPLPFFSSYFFAYKDDPKVKKNTKRASQIITAALEFRKAVLSQELEPERTKAYAMCMDSYKWMFNASRYPKQPSDYEKVFDPQTNNHIAVVRKNKFYIVELIQNGKQLTSAELEQQLDKIVQEAGQQRGPAIGVLTADNRDKWTEYRERLLAASPDNAALLEKIESSVFLVALDDSSPVTREEIARACWHGDGKNRYFDKSLQFIIFENGKAGFNGEHSSMDGTPTARLNDFICHNLSRGNIQHHYDQAARSDLATPKRLDFTVSPLVSRAIQESTQRFDEWVNKHEVQVLLYHGYGKNFIKKCKISPDAFVQMIIQLAYYNMHGVSRPTYESAATRKYLKGRTETVRTVSLESVDFVKTMNDPTASKELKAQKLQQACQSHVKYMSDAVDARGVDRHLLGLRLCLDSNEPKPSIFADPAYSYSCHWNLSTSQLASEYFQGYGWGEVVPDGYGLPYMINNESLQFHISCLRSMKAAHLKHHLDTAATEIKALFDGAQAAPSAKL